MHVYQLRRKIQVALQIAGVYHINHNIRGFLDELSADIQLFRRIRRQRICAGQIYDVELISFKCGTSLLGINGNAGIVAYFFMGTGCEVKQGCLAAIGIAYKCYVYGASFLQCSIVQLLIAQYGQVILIFVGYIYIL